MSEMFISILLKVLKKMINLINFFNLFHSLKKHQFCCMKRLFLAKVITVTISTVLHLFLPILAPASTLVEYERLWYLYPWDRSKSKAWTQHRFSRYSRSYSSPLVFQVPGCSYLGLHAEVILFAALQSIMFLAEDQAVHFHKQGLLTN